MVKNKIPNITNLATTTALTAVENKIPNVSNFVKKSDYNTQISEIENKISTDYGHDILLLKNSISLQQISYFKINTSKFSEQKWYCQFRKNWTDLNKNELK